MTRKVELTFDLNELTEALARSIGSFLLVHPGVHMTGAQVNELARNLAQTCVALGEDLDDDLLTSTQPLDQSRRK